MDKAPELAKTLLRSDSQAEAEGAAAAPPDTVGATLSPAETARTSCPAAGPALADASREGRRTTVLPTLTLTDSQPQVSTARRERFEEMRPLGQGGMGEVVLVQDHDIERAVALKRLPPQADVGSVLRFVDEIRTVGSLEHPNIVPLHDVGVDEQGRYFFVMKHLQGETLEAIIEKLKAGDPAAHRRFTFTVRQQLFLNVLNAVNYAHQQGVIHRDLKPSNIMVGPFGEVTLMDWGLAKRLRDGRPELPAALQASGPAPLPSSPSGRDRGAYATQLGQVMGTPMYMSPEQARGDTAHVDERTDIYALAVVYHELMYLQHYLEHCQAIPEILDGVQATEPALFSMRRHPHQRMVPPECAWFASKGLKKDPAQRYQSVQEMIDRLQCSLSGRVVVQCQFTLVKRGLQELQRASDAHPLVVMGGLIGAVGLLAAALLKAAFTLF